MENLKELISKCKAEVCITVNEHKSAYKDVISYFTCESYTNPELLEEIGEDVYQRMVETDTIIEIQFYPDTPVGFYRVYHYDLEKAIEIALETLKQ